MATTSPHEIGHALGCPTGAALGTPAEALLSEFLTLGTRRSPGVAASETVPSDLLADEAQAAPMLGFARPRNFGYAPLALSQWIGAPPASASPVGYDHSARIISTLPTDRGFRFELHHLELVTDVVGDGQAESSRASVDAESERPRLAELPWEP